MLLVVVLLKRQELLLGLAVACVRNFVVSGRMIVFPSLASWRALLTRSCGKGAADRGMWRNGLQSKIPAGSRRCLDNRIKGFGGGIQHSQVQQVDVP